MAVIAGSDRRRLERCSRYGKVETVAALVVEATRRDSNPIKTDFVLGIVPTH